jgi:beta-glucosidase
MEEVDRAVSCVLRLKFALGLFDHPYTDESVSDSVILKPEHLRLARQAAEESFVLLKNDGFNGKQILPLADGQTVALLGNLANSGSDMLGAWGYLGQGQDVVTLRQALSERLKDKLVYAEGSGPNEKSEKGFAQALEVAKKADVIIMALGESSSMSGEAYSRSQLGLPGNQIKLLQAVVALGKPVVLVLFNGRPLALPWEAEHVPAILEAWFPGVQAGPALVNTLYGENNPAGKLTASFPRSVGQMPLYYNALTTGKPQKPGKPDYRFVTGYVDVGNTPQFPFGWGLSYTKFDYSAATITTSNISASQLNGAGTIMVEASVKNTGERAGSEVVELFINQRGTSVARPIRELKGFQKITLAPGESKTVRFALTKKELSFWNLDMKYVVEPAELTVWVAPNTQSGVPATIRIQP